MRNWFSPLTIKPLSFYKKQLLLILAVNATCLALASILFFSTNVSSFKDQLETSILGKIKLIESSTASALLFDDQDAATNILSAFNADSSILYAAIYNAEGVLFSEFRRNEGTVNELSTPNEAGFYDKEIHFEIYDDILFQNEIIGHIHILSSKNIAEKQINQYLKIVFAVFTLSLILAFLLSRYAQRWLSKPIEELVDIAKYVSTKSLYDRRIESHRNDELGTLISGFNVMLDTIEDREKELTKYNIHMEELVAERTVELDKKANYDALTHLPNRNLLMEKMEQSVELAKRNRVTFSVMFMDLDRFKVINDNLGHATGDELLIQVARRLENTVRKIDTVARWGGDEFVVVLEGIGREEDAAQVARKIINELERPFIIREQVLHISTCIGICCFPNDGSDSATLLKHADMSMYEAKDNGVGSYCFFEKEMQIRSIERLSLEAELRHAIEENELFVMYQPQYNVNSGDIASAEALIRWKHPVKGIIGPDVFIPIAEEAGLVNNIGLWVIAEVCRQIREWQNEGKSPVRVAVNISALHIVDPKLPDAILKTLEKYDLPAGLLEIEITESSLVEVSENIFSILSSLRNSGIRIAIDDFGAGYSCLRYLCDFPLDTLKIDGSFVQGIGKKGSKQGVVAATVALGHYLDMEVVAECVEEEEQFQYLKDIECDVIQGYFFSKPIDAKELMQVVDDYALKKIS